MSVVGVCDEACSIRLHDIMKSCPAHVQLTTMHWIWHHDGIPYYAKGNFATIPNKSYTHLVFYLWLVPNKKEAQALPALGYVNGWKISYQICRSACSCVDLGVD